MRKALLQILIGVSLGFSIFGQNEKPVLFDEFGPLALGDLSSRLDGFRNELKSKENSLALIRIYVGTGDDISFPYVRKAFYEAYFSNFSFNDRDKLTLQICDSDETEIRNQFFIVPPNTKIDECESNLKIPQQTVLIKNETFYPVALTDSVDDYLDTKGIDKAVTEASKIFLTELLIKSPDSKICLISYAGRYFKAGEDESENEIVSKTDSPTVNDRDLKKIKKR